MTESINMKTTPSICNYMPSNSMEESMGLSDGSADQMDFFDTPVVLEDSNHVERHKRRIVEQKTPQEIRTEALAAMKATLLDAIEQTCVLLIQSSRDRLKKQYKNHETQMEMIQRKPR